MKNNISYYSHEVNSHNHWKFKTLRRKYGWAGEGKFWALNNMIAESENCLIDLSNKSKKLAIAAELDFDLDELDAFIDYLRNTCQLLVDVDSLSTTKRVQQVLAQVAEKRKKQRDWKREKSTVKNEESTGKVQKSTTKVKKSTVEKQQSKVKESKVKEREREHAREFEEKALTSEDSKCRFAIPDIDQVTHQFHLRGGTQEMAEKFFLTHQATDWHLRGSPITQYTSLIPSYIHNFLKNEKAGTIYVPGSKKIHV